MNVRKIIEEEINKLLEREEAPPIGIAGDEEMNFTDDEADVIKAPAAKKITIGSINKPLEYEEFKKT